MRTALARRSAILTAYIAPANSGLLRVYAGARPANADTALSGNTLLATLVMNATSFVESSGIMTANAIASVTAVASGTASFTRLFRSDGTTVEHDFGVTTGASAPGTEVSLNTLSIVLGAPVSVSSFTFSYGVGA